MYLPGFPAIARDLQTTIANVQLSLTSYFAGIAAGQLLYGPLLDRFGRKPPLYAGLVVYLAASIGCAFSETVETLILMRFLQAVGGCAGMVAAQTLVRDLFPVNRTAQAFSWITLVIAVSPMIAPTFGGFLTAMFGWHSVFFALAILSIIMLILVVLILPSGRAADRSLSLKPLAVISNFGTVLRQPQFITYSIAGALGGCATFAFIAGSADVFINYYGASEQAFGMIFAMVGAVIIGFTQFNHLLLRKFQSEQIVFASFAFQIVSGSFLLIGVWQNWFDMISFIVFTLLFLSVHGLSNANASALALAPFTKNTGSAASLLGTFRMAAGGISSALVSIFHNGSPAPMVIMMALAAATGFVMLITARTVIRYRARKSDEDSPPIF
jgi:DHA1 family bicyclomycin/chloramphenicol resistance-like MFS transporter